MQSKNAHTKSKVFTVYPLACQEKHFSLRAFPTRIQPSLQACRVSQNQAYRVLQAVYEVPPLVQGQEAARKAAPEPPCILVMSLAQPCGHDGILLLAGIYPDFLASLGPSFRRRTAVQRKKRPADATPSTPEHSQARSLV